MRTFFFFKFQCSQVIFSFCFNQDHGHFVLKEEFRVGPVRKKEGHSIGNVAMCWSVSREHFFDILVLLK